MSFKSFITDSGAALASNPDTLARRLEAAEQRVAAIRADLEAARAAQEAIRTPEMLAEMRAIAADGSDHPDMRHQVPTGFGSFSLRKYAEHILAGLGSRSGRISGNVNMFKALRG